MLLLLQLADMQGVNCYCVLQLNHNPIFITDDLHHHPLITHITFICIVHHTNVLYLYTDLLLGCLC